MKIFLSNAEERLLDDLAAMRLRKDSTIHAVLFQCSVFKHFDLHKQEVACIAMRDNMLDTYGGIYGMRTGDIIMLLENCSQEEIDEIIKDLKILFADLPEAQLDDWHLSCNLREGYKDFFIQSNCMVNDARVKAAAEARAKMKDVPMDAQKFRVTELSRKVRRRPVLMLIDDDPFVSQVFADLMTGYEIHKLQTAKDGLKEYQKNAPDILFLDFNLPDMSGAEVIRKLNGIDERAFIVMLSGNSSVDRIKEAVDLGAKGFITKPFSKKKIDEYITMFSEDRKPAA